MPVIRYFLVFIFNIFFLLFTKLFMFVCCFYRVGERWRLTDLGPGFLIHGKAFVRRCGQRSLTLDLGFGPFFSILLLKADKAFIDGFGREMVSDHPYFSSSYGEDRVDPHRFLNDDPAAYGWCPSSI